MNRVLIVGASARAAAWSARLAGLEVVAADLFADCDLQQHAETIQVSPREYPQVFAEFVKPGSREVKADAWLYTGCLENYPGLVNRMSRLLPLLGNKADAIRKVRDPSWLARLFATQDISFPRLANIDEIGAGAAGWLLKPFASGGGQHVQYGKPTAPSPDGSARFYLQQFIEGQPHSAVYVGNEQQCNLLGVTRLWCERDLFPDTTRHPFRYSGSTGPVVLSHAGTRQWQQIGNAVHRHAGLRGVFGVDAIVSTSGATAIVWPVEVNPRYTASVEILERALNFSALAAHIRVWTAQRGRVKLAIDLDTTTPSYCGKRILYARSPVIFAGPVYDSLMAWQAGDRTRQIADRPKRGTEIVAEAPVCTLIASAETLGEVEAALGFEPRQSECVAVLA